MLLCLCVLWQDEFLVYVFKYRIKFHKSVDVTLKDGITHVNSFNSPNICGFQKVAVDMVVTVIVMTRFYPKQTLESEIVAHPACMLVILKNTA